MFGTTTKKTCHLNERTRVLLKQLRDHKFLAQPLTPETQDMLAIEACGDSVPLVKNPILTADTLQGHLEAQDYYVKRMDAWSIIVCTTPQNKNK